MLPKINRLKKDKDIKKVLERGKRFQEDFLVLKVSSNTIKETRFAFIVSQKFSKKATLRNVIKRRLKNLTRPNLKKIKEGVDVVIIAIPGLENKNFSVTKETLNMLFKKAALFKKEK